MNAVHSELSMCGERFKKVGLKATHQRAEIYRELMQTTEHPDAETLYRRVKVRIPAISFDTVYRTLRTLEEKGLVGRVGAFLERSRFDADMEPHHHFVCVQCGIIRDVRCKALNEVKAPEELAAFGVATDVRVEIRGVCTGCAGKAGASAG